MESLYGHHGNVIVGTPNQLLEQMRPFVDLGIDYFMLDYAGFPKPTTLQMLISEVLPRLADFASP